MTSTIPASKGGQPPDPRDFSIVLGGPLFQLLRWAHLSDDALLLVQKRIVVISLFAWLPLLVLSVLGGNFLKGSVAVPFLRDIEVHVRFLVAMPLLIGAELLVDRRMRPLTKQFLDRQLVPDGAMPRFEAAIASAARLRNSVIAEVLLIALVYGVGVPVWRQSVALNAATWYATPSSTDGVRLSIAGWWYAYVSLPVFQFLLVRWYFRVFIWARFLWQVSRIRLNLVPTHPDRAGGLGFLAILASAFVPLGAGPRSTARWPDRQPHLLPGCGTAPVQGRDCRHGRVHAHPRPESPASVRRPARRSEADGPSGVRHAGATLRARVRREMAAWRSGTRGAAGGQWRHPVARRPGHGI